MEGSSVKIPNIIRRLIPPYEVKVTCRDIDAFLQADDGLCIDQIRKEVLILAKDTDKVLYSIRIDGLKPDQLALILIFNVLTRDLESGWYHGYRGVLTGIGQDMLRLWHITEKEMIKRGYSTDDQYDIDTEGLMESIRSVA
jgi:hypothetical protein